MRRRYLTEAVQTATPAARLGMLFDRLVLDLARADAAFEAGEMKDVNDNLIHAQEILLALRGTLRTDKWDAASGLAALYTFLHGQLVTSNIEKDREKAAVAAGMVGQLAAAWRNAAEAGPSEPAREGVLTGGLA